MNEDFSSNISNSAEDLVNVTQDDIKIHNFENVLEAIKATDTSKSIEVFKTINMIRELFVNSSLNDAPNADEYVFTLCQLLNIENPPNIIDFGVLCSLEILCIDSCKLNLEASKEIIPVAMQLIESDEPTYSGCGLMLLFAICKRSSEQTALVLEEISIEQICNYIIECSDGKVQTNAMRLLASMAKWNFNLLQNSLTSLIHTAKLVILNSLGDMRNGSLEIEIEKVEWGLKIIISTSQCDSWFDACISHGIIELIQGSLFEIKRSHIRADSIKCLSLLFCKRGDITINAFDIDFVIQNMTHQIELIRGAAINFVISALDSKNGKIALAAFVNHGIVEVILSLIQNGKFKDKIAMLKILKKFVDCVNDPALYSDSDAMADAALDAILKFYNEIGIQQVVSMIENCDTQTANECICVFANTFEKLRQRNLDKSVTEAFVEAGGIDALTNVLDSGCGVDQEMVEFLLSCFDTE